MFSKEELQLLFGALKKLQDEEDTPAIRGVLKSIVDLWEKAPTQGPIYLESFSPNQVYMLALLTNSAFFNSLDDSRLLDAQTKGHITQDPLVVLAELHEIFIKAWVEHKETILNHVDRRR